MGKFDMGLATSSSIQLYMVKVIINLQQECVEENFIGGLPQMVFFGASNGMSI